jgi:branched-chain amino acid aminotransferase
MRLYWKGRLIEEAQARIPFSEEGLLDGSALAEMMNFRAGKVRNFGLHLSRLNEGARALMMPQPRRGELRAASSLLIRANRLRQGRLRCRYFRSGALLLHPLPPHPAMPKGGISLVTGPARHYGPESLQGRLKAASMLPNLLALRESGAFAPDALRLTPLGRVGEAVWSNIMVEKGGELRTPPLSEGILEGTGRIEALRRWRAKGGRVLERPLTRYDLYSADRVWLCSGTRGLVKVLEVDGRKIGKP